MNKTIFLSLFIVSSLFASSKEEKKIRNLEKGKIFLTLQINTSRLNNTDFKNKGQLVMRVTSDRSVQDVITTLTENLNQRSKSKQKSDYVPEEKTVILKCNGAVLPHKSILAALVTDHTLRAVSQSKKKKKQQNSYWIDASFYQD